MSFEEPTAFERKACAALAAFQYGTSAATFATKMGYRGCRRIGQVGGRQLKRLVEAGLAECEFVQSAPGEPGVDIWSLTKKGKTVAAGWSNDTVVQLAKAVAEHVARRPR